SASQPKWRRHRPLATYRRMSVPLQHTPHPAHTQPAAPGAGAAAVGDQSVFLDTQRKAHLQDFDRRVHQVADGARYRVDAVLDRPRAEAAFDRLITHI